MRAFFFATVLWLVGCNSPTQPGAIADGGSSPTNFSSGTWVFENISNSTAPSRWPSLVSSVEGTRAAWSEGDRILVAARQGSDWSTTTLSGSHGEIREFPNLLDTASGLLLAFSEYSESEGTETIELVVETSAGWSSAIEVSRADPDVGWSHTFPLLIPLGNDEVGCVYRSTRTVSADEEQVRLKLVRIVHGEPVGPPDVILDRSGFCGSVSAAGDGSGVAHVFAACSSGNDEAVYVTNASGAWTREVRGLDGLQSWTAVAVHEGAAHLVWTDGDPVEIWYSQAMRLADAEPTRVLSMATRPAIALDPFGRLMIFGVGYDGALHQTHSDGQATSFSAPIAVATPTSLSPIAPVVQFAQRGEVEGLVWVRGADSNEDEILHMRFMPEASAR